MDTAESSSEDYSIGKGGPFFNLVRKIPFITSQKRAALLGLCVTWLPLAIICAYEGTLFSGVQMPFLFDWAMQMRVLIAFPMMIIIRDSIDKNTMNVLKSMGVELLEAGDRQLLIDNLFRRARQMSGSAFSEIFILAIVVLSTVSLVKSGFFSGLEGETTTWMAYSVDNVQHLSMAGFWAVFICIPIIQFSILRWIWRYIVWIFLLFRFSGAKLKLMPTHADRAGGIGILMVAQRSYNLFFVSVGVILSGELINTLLKYPDLFNTIRNEAFGFIVICIFLLIIAVIFFIGKLSKAKNDGLLRLGNLGADLSRKFEHDWVNDRPVESILDESRVDPSLLFDYAGMYDSLQEMRTIPVSMRDIITMAGMLFVPFIPIVFIHFSVAELLQKIAGILL